MRFFFGYKKGVAACLLISIVLQAGAQDQRFRFFPINRPGILREGFAGQLGKHFLFVEEGGIKGARLYLHDTAANSGKEYEYLFPTSINAIHIQDTAAIVFSLTGSNPVILHLLEINEEGKELRRKDIHLPLVRGGVKLISSDNRQSHLLYQLVKKQGDSLLLQGVIINRDWAIQKTLSYGLAHNTEMDAEPEVFLDNMANTHVVVYDKFSNYRISTDLTLNTVPAAEETMISETFSFQKVKLKTMKIFQNNECNCIQSEGMYAEGQGKKNRGIYSIAFPPGRQNQLAPRFIPFTEEMIRNFRKGFSATDEMVQNSLQLHDILYSDSGSFVLLRLQVGMVQRNNALGETDPSLGYLSKSVAISRATDPVLVTTSSSSSPATANSPVPRMRPATNGDRYANTNTMAGNGLKNQSPLYSKSTGRNAPKIIVVKLDKDKGIDWYQGKSLDQFAVSEEAYNRQYIAAGIPNEIRMLLYEADAQEEPSPVMLSMLDGQLVKEKVPAKKIVWMPPRFIRPGVLGAIYYENGINGLLIVKDRAAALTRN